MDLKHSMLTAEERGAPRSDRSKLAFERWCRPSDIYIQSTKRHTTEPKEHHSFREGRKKSTKFSTTREINILKIPQLAVSLTPP